MKMVIMKEEREKSRWRAGWGQWSAEGVDERKSKEKERKKWLKRGRPPLYQGSLLRTVCHSYSCHSCHVTHVMSPPHPLRSPSPSFLVRSFFHPPPILARTSVPFSLRIHNTHTTTSLMSSNEREREEKTRKERGESEREGGRGRREREMQRK